MIALIMYPIYIRSLMTTRMIRCKIKVLTIPLKKVKTTFISPKYVGITLVDPKLPDHIIILLFVVIYIRHNDTSDVRD